MKGCNIAGDNTIIKPNAIAPVKINCTPAIPPDANITAIIQARYNVWCPVKKIYLNFVNLAIIILAIIPNAIIKAVAVPNSSIAKATTASLFGITPDILNACENIVPNGVNELVITFAAALITKKPTIAFNVDLIITSKSFF